jgi:hypothetical protein
MTLLLDRTPAQLVQLPKTTRRTGEIFWDMTLRDMLLIMTLLRTPTLNFIYSNGTMVMVPQVGGMLALVF